MREAFADDFTWHQRAEWPGRPVYRIDELPDLWAELDETYSEFVLEPVEFAEVGNCVLVKVHTSAPLHASNERIDGVIWHVWQIVDGRVQNVHVYTERSDALEAAEKQ
jgi:ketosteroid isomerase-like protein